MDQNPGSGAGTSVFDTKPLLLSTDPLSSSTPSVNPSPVQEAQQVLSSASATPPVASTPAPTPAAGNQLYIKRHVRRRLGHAKESCDKELKKVVQSITTYVEERIQETDYDDIPLTVMPSDTASEDGGDEADIEVSVTTRHIRLPSTANSSPNSFRRHPSLPHRNTNASPSATSHSGNSELSPTKRTPLQTPTKQAGGNGLTRRFSRSIRASAVPISGPSSRSPSRSRSPMPPQTVSTGSGDNVLPGNVGLSSSPALGVANRKLSRYEYEDYQPTTPPADVFISTLQAVIAFATDVIDMPISKLTSEPKACSELVQKVQNIGKAWDEHPDWHGRNWYVQLLLAVASLSRVVEWFEAERQFWNFEGDEGDATEQLTFVLKPRTREGSVNESFVPSTASTTGRFEQQMQQQSKSGTSSPSQTDERPSTRASSSSNLKHLRRSASLGQVHPSGSPQSSEQAAVDSSGVLGIEQPELSREEASETLRQQAEEAQSLNIVLELTLDGENGQQFAWINPAWFDIIGTDPDRLIGTGVSEHLAESDSDVFAEATRQLQEDDSHTLEVRFRIMVKPSDVDDGEQWYRQMEGKGMLMYDRADGTPSHTMWVLKPLGPPEVGNRIEMRAEAVGREPSSAGPGFHRRGINEPVTPFPYLKDVPAGSILCRICEVEIPSWFFVKHNDTCMEEHRIEASIAEINESIVELRNTVRELKAALDRPATSGVPEYRGEPIFSPAVSPPSSSLTQFFKPPLSARLQKASVRKLQHKLLTQIEEILQTTQDVSMPALREDQAQEPIERQRVLSPDSMERMIRARNWTRPTSDDPALANLVNDAAMLVRSKLEEVTRLSNTVRYSEKVRQEWEEDYIHRQAAVEAAVSASKEQSMMTSSSIAASSEQGDVSSATSEYAFDGDTDQFTYPTSVRPISPAPNRGRGGWRSAIGAIFHPSSSNLSMSRASTPPSISSPLALAAPIVASVDSATTAPSEELQLPPTASASTQSSAQTVRTRAPTMTAMVGEPRFVLTPPVSPSISAQENPRHKRRLSNLPMLSPAVSVAGSIIAAGPPSPRVSTTVPPKTHPASIKDFDIVKPISKGAFGSVFLAKKKATGDYYAIKVLRKADMISKNQITNVKAERMILMKQADSPFVVKLFYTFQSKDNLYLVMEYLNGGDCAALVKALGSLPEEWTKAYVAEIVLGLEYLHTRGVVHRDLKPDNLLIDQHGHLKLTDFGLSRIGLLNRQTRDTRIPDHRGSGHGSGTSRSASIDASRLGSPFQSGSDTTGQTCFNARTNSSTVNLTGGDDVSESSGSESISSMFLKRSSSAKRKPKDSPVQSFADLTNDLRSHSNANVERSMTGTPQGPRFVGTPDYLAPEIILGYGGGDKVLDWWALGVISYEFLYGDPPFHADTAEQVFENIISRRIEWHEEWVDFSSEARDFMERLMCIDPTQRLGYNGPQEVKQHPFLADVDWDNVMTSEPQFVPSVTDPESTDYFDPRGAIPQLFHDDELVAVTGRPSVADSSKDEDPSVPPSHQQSPVRELFSPSTDEFGTFNFKNLPVLKQANDELIRKLHTSPASETGSPATMSQGQSLSEPPTTHIDRRRSVSQRGPKALNVHPPPPPPPPPIPIPSDPRTSPAAPAVQNPPSPSNSTSSGTSAFSRGPSTPASANAHVRRPSEFGPVERFKQNHLDMDGHRRNSMPSRLRTSSMSSSDFAGVDPWPSDKGTADPPQTSSSQVASERKHQNVSDKVVTCLLAEDNPISIKILETLLTRMGVHCVLVSDGAEAISVALGDIKFDLILMDLNMPNVDGETAARYIKSTNNKNANTPTVAVSAYSMLDSETSNGVFVASVAKPVQRADLLAVLKQLGFRVTTQAGGKSTSKVVK